MDQKIDMNDWERRSAQAWAEIDEYYARGEAGEADFRARICELAGELPKESPIAAFERACAWDSTGHSDRAVPLYEEALEGGLAGIRRRRAVIQMSSSLRNIGRVEESVVLLTAEAENYDPDAAVLADAVSAVLALCLVDVGREREAVSVAVRALAPHLPRYQRSMANYARLLVEPDPA
ncbi:tetratricopeptide repeat protein [Streptomyces sp. RB6PN25]|uniref:Tetratricopeptide repeat protein n=1 Tax=Streptomyces humicola TaxID=2953240 RepID=A0ABT1PYR6_9ACTN|nr:tetratricopeptide repeat protein [Streptomyces humicola]MCQ4082806.1 tetratricopeptide repeat protein [Streptomyces humicola]